MCLDHKSAVTSLCSRHNKMVAASCCPCCTTLLEKACKLGLYLNLIRLRPDNNDSDIGGIMRHSICPVNAHLTWITILVSVVRGDKNPVVHTTGLQA